MQELHKEWESLRESAGQRLEGAYSVSEPGIECLFRLLVRPAFDPEFSWRVLRQNQPLGRGTPTYCARHLCWRKDIDGEKLHNPVERLRHPYPLSPTFETQEIGLETAFVDGALAQLSRITVPAYPINKRIGLDGTTYQLRIGNYFQHTEYRWWEEPPETWQPLRDFFNEMITSLEILRQTVPVS